MGSALTAVDDLIDSFGRHDRDAYFDCFAADATFLFHTSARRLENRAEYEVLWRKWEDEDGFRVLSCLSTNRRLQTYGEIAIFSHDVKTELNLAGETRTIGERETIIMHLENGQWLGVHEHLSLGAAA